MANNEMTHNTSWYFAKDGRRFGPFSASALKEQVLSGQLLATDYVWKEGMSRWAEARSVRGLFDTSATIPPAIPTTMGYGDLPRHSVYEGIVFCEKDLPMCERIRTASIAIHGFFSQSQLKSLDDVKKRLVTEVRSSRGNCMVNFQYGQRSTWWTTLLGIDDVSWYGSGVIGTIPSDLYQHIVEVTCQQGRNLS